MRISGLRIKDSLEYHGNQGLILSVIGSLKEDEKGIATCTAEWTIRSDRWEQLPKRGSPHPVWKYVSMVERETSIEGAFAVARCDYAGTSSSETAAPTYELVIGVENQAIQTHPLFDTEIAGTPTDRKNGSMWKLANDESNVLFPNSTNPGANDNYVFWKFKDQLGGSKNPFAGLEEYLDACMVTWRKSSIGRAHPSDIAKAGFIDTPEGPYPKLPQGKGETRNWLNLGTTSTQRGAAYEITTEWRASARRGWNQTVYGKR